MPVDETTLMRRALKLAERGTGSTYPNPCVGAVVARGNDVLGEARSAPTGGPHAEVGALAKAGAKAKGATLYVSLEPCAHTGRTGPCSEAIIAAGIKRVVIGARDPAPHANGAGIVALEAAGIAVVVGDVLGEHAREVHAHYLHQVTTKRPFVTLKAAVSLDGRLAVSSGESKWITGEASRKHAHGLRASHHAIAVGIGTVLQDDPALTVRLVDGVDPLPIVFDSRLRIMGRGVKAGLRRKGTWVLHTQSATPRRVEAALAAGLVPIRVRATAAGTVSVSDALRVLGKREVRSLMVEGGGRLLGSFIAADRFQQLVLYRAPLVLGSGISLAEGFAASSVKRAPRLETIVRKRLGDDELSVFVHAAR